MATVLLRKVGEPDNGIGGVLLSKGLAVFRVTAEQNQTSVEDSYEVNFPDSNTSIPCQLSESYSVVDFSPPSLNVFQLESDASDEPDSDEIRAYLDGEDLGGEGRPKWCRIVRFC
jgi:hypothetical protein